MNATRLPVLPLAACALIGACATAPAPVPVAEPEAVTPQPETVAPQPPAETRRAPSDA
jgi:hypothetical protein